jgi:hypothetical protein
VNKSISEKIRSMRWFSLALGILLALIIVLFLGFRTDFFARGIGRLASDHFLGGTPFSISVEKLEGSVFQDVTLKGIKMHYSGPDASFDLFRAEELSIRYDLLMLMKKRPRIRDISMTKPVLRLKADSTGVFILPSFGADNGELPLFEIVRFSIEEGHVIIQGIEKSDVLSTINVVGSIMSGGSTLHLTIAQGSAENENRNFTVRSLKGGITLSLEAAAKDVATAPATRITLDSLAIVLKESAFICSGLIVPSTRLFDVAVDAEPVEIEEITRILQIETSHDGVIKGAFTLKGKPERFRLAGTINGVLSGYALDDFGVNLRRDAGVIRLDHFSGTLNGAHVEGSGRYTLETPNVLSLDLDVRGVDLSKGFVPRKELPETRFNGKVKLTYGVQSEALSFALELGEGDFKRVPFTGALLRGSYANDTLKAEEIVLSHPTHTVSARGRIVGESEISFFFNVECAARDTLFSYFDIEEYRADVRFNGRWEGTFDAYDLRMSGACNNLRYRDVQVPEGGVKLAIEKNGDYAVLFDLDGPGCRVGPATFSDISLSLEYRNDVTNIKKLSLSREHFTADITADVRRERNETVVRFKECSLNAFGETWVGGGAFAVFIGDSAVRFDDLQFHSKAGAAYVDGTLGLASKTLRGRFAFERFGIDLLNRVGLVKTPLEGKAHGTLLCSGSYTDPDLGMDIAVEGGRIDTFIIDTLRLRAEYARSRCAFDSLLIASPSGSLSLGGEISGMPIRTVVRAAGPALKGATAAVEISCRNLDMAPLLSLAGIRRVSGGRLNGSISIADSLVHPLASFKGRINNLAISSFKIPSIDCEVKLEGGNLTADGTLHVSPAHEGSFHCAVPLLPGRFLYALDRVRPVVLEVHLPEGDLAALPSMTDFVAEAAGRYSGQLSVTGTIAAPHLYGDLYLKGAGFRLSGMEEKYSQVDATVRLEDTLITITGFTGKEEKKGTVGGGGWVALEGWRPAKYHLAVSVNEFVLASLPNVLAIVSGTLNVTTRVENGKALPLLSGLLEVNKSELYYDLSSFSSSEAGLAVEEPSWLAAIDLKIPGNTWIRTPDARVELQGNVTLYHDGKGTYLSGELNLVRGWYNVYNNKFRITSGKLQFVLAGSVRPVIDIEAETRDPEGRTIYLTFQWHQDDLQPRLSLRHEDPGYSETDIWKMLGGGVVAAEGQEASWDARGTAQNLAANYIERVLNSQMEGVTIELEAGTGSNPIPGMGDFRDTKIAIGKYLSQGLYVKYKQGLSISSARQIEVEYRISDLFILRSEVIRYFEKAIQSNSPRSSDEINVDLKLRWEY